MYNEQALKAHELGKGMLENADILANVAWRIRTSIVPGFYRTSDGTVFEVNDRVGVRVIQVEDVP